MSEHKQQFLDYVKNIQLGLTSLEGVFTYPKLSAELRNGEKLTYIKKGTGKNTIIFVHGNMSSSIHYSPLLDILPTDFTAYAPDLRGFGDSSYNESINSLSDFADDLYLFVKKLNLADFTLVGWSTGGGVCLRFDERHPGLCTGIVLIDSVAANGYAIYQHDIYGREIEGKIYNSKEDLICDPYHAMLSYNFLTQNYMFMYSLWKEKIYTVKSPSLPKNYLYLTESLKQCNIIDVEWSLATFNMTSKKNAYVPGDSGIDKITVPVLCIRGKDDVVVTEKMFDLTIEAIGENAERAEFFNCGHSPFVDCPDTLADAVFEFAVR